QPLRAFNAALSPDQLPRRELVRTRRIELLSPGWRPAIEPINYIRVSWAIARRRRQFGAPPRIRTSRRPTFLFHRRRFYRPVAGKGRGLLVWLSRRDSNARPPLSDSGTLLH